jgi:hypothetical protein
MSDSTFDRDWEPSGLPHPSLSDLTPGGARFSPGGGHVGLSTMGTAVHFDPSGDAHTRWKQGPANANSLGGGGGGDDGGDIDGGDA